MRALPALELDDHSITPPDLYRLRTLLRVCNHPPSTKRLKRVNQCRPRWSWFTTSRESSKQTVDALRLVGYEVAAFSDPMAALEKAQRVEMLIKLACAFRMETERRRSGSIARHKRPGAARIRPTRGRVGEFMPVPIDLPELVATVG